jgi:hypothetical protein
MDKDPKMSIDISIVAGVRVLRTPVPGGGILTIGMDESGVSVVITGPQGLRVISTGASAEEIATGTQVD